ncbi:hypothetical protein QBC39DRAFT_356589 [Podospora conica]|nr:hypothetical protein QBC39DRAFT_356589 [Schizothecium conicum]
MTASQCRSALSVNGALATEVAGCFVSIGRPQFAPQSAYSCVSAAPIYCTSTTASCDPYATPTPVIINGGFESGDVGPWVPTITSAPGNVVGAVSNERPHSGSNSYKVEFKNIDGGLMRLTQAIKIEPGKNYEVSYWWYASNNVAYAGSNIQVSFPGRSFYVSINSDSPSRAPNTWHRESLTFNAPVSFATVMMAFSANRGPSDVVMYLDDASIVQIP